MTSLLMLLTHFASAADVISTDSTPVSQTWLSQAQGAQVSAVELIDSLYRFTKQDQAALDNLAVALTEVRAFESELDGELLILEDLEGPVQAVKMLRNEADAAKLFSALAYQGFAANRFFAEDLATDDRAEPYRIEVDGKTIVRPWADAAALRPGTKATAYDIAEAAERTAFSSTSQTVETTLPGAIRIEGAPEDAQLTVDGRPMDMSATGNIRLQPGRHLVHLTSAEGHALGRWDTRLVTAKTETLVVQWSESAVLDDIAGLQAGSSIPDNLANAVDARGEALWVLREVPGTKKQPATAEVLVIEPKAKVVTTRTLTMDIATSTQTDAQDNGLRISVGAGSGWFFSDDFYLQDTVSTPRTAATVNAVSVDASVQVAYQAGLFQGALGTDIAVPLGANHVAFSGESRLRVRPTPYLAAGLPWVMASVGYQFPYHLTVGGRAQVPLYDGLHLLIVGHAGIPSSLNRSDGTNYQTGRAGQIWGGLAWQFGAP